MAYDPILSFDEFEGRVRARCNNASIEEKYREEVHSAIPLVKTRISNEKYFESFDEGWPLWLSDFTRQKGFSLKKRAVIESISASKVYTFSKPGKLGGSLLYFIAIHYRLHMYHKAGDLELAERLDVAVFESTLRESGITVFRYEPNRYTFPARKAPMSPPPYLTRDSIESRIAKNPNDAVWLSPHNHITIPLEGRGKEWTQLDAFMKTRDPFRIQPVIGPSGSGKTRLISEWMKQYVTMNDQKTNWDAGILITEESGTGRQHARDPKPWEDWKIEDDTLIVIDYTHAFDDVVRTIYEKATCQKADKPKRVRVVLLDHVMPEFLGSDFLWNKITGGTTAGIDSAQSNFLVNKIALRPFGNDATLMRHVITAAANVGRDKSDRLKPDDPLVGRAVKHLESLGADDVQRNAVRHPLFAALLGQVIRENARIEIDFTALRRRDLLENYFKSPDRLPWKGWDLKSKDANHLKRSRQGREHGLLVGALVAAATLRRGLPTLDAAKHHPELLEERGEHLVQRAGRIVSSEDQKVIQPFLPDILGETFVLKYLEEVVHRSDHFQSFLRILSEAPDDDAQEIASNFYETVERTARNLAHDDQARLDVQRSWRALAMLLNPEHIIGNSALRLAVSYAIADVMEHLTRLINRGRDAPPLKRSLDNQIHSQFIRHSQDVLHSIDHRFAEAEIEHAINSREVIKASGMFFRFFEHSSRQLYNLEGILASITNSFASRKRGELTALELASYFGYLRCAKAVVELTAESPSDRFSNGVTALMVSSYGGHLSVAQFLFDHSPDLITAKANNGATAMMGASENGHLPVVEFLHAQNPDLIGGTMANGATAIILASENGHLSVVEFLHAKNPELIAATMTNGVTAMLIASANGHLPVVEFLYAEDANLITTTANNGANALMLACQNGHLPVVEFLHDQNPDLIAATMTNGVTAIMLAIANGRLPVVEFFFAEDANLITTTMNNGANALMLACENGHLPVAEFLHDQNPDLIAATADGGASAVMLASQNGHLPVVEFLHAQNPHLIAATADDGGTTVMLASQNGHLAVVEFLHARNPDLIAATADDGKTAVMLASQQGHLTVVEFLHAQNPDLIAGSTDDGWTPVMLASTNGHLPVVKFLHAQNSGLIAAKMESGATAIIGASLNGHLPVVEFLHAQNPDLITATKDNGWTAVMLASQNGHLSVVEFLHAQKPDLTAAITDDGWTTAMSAGQNGHLAVVEFLHSQNPDLIAATTNNGVTAIILASVNGHLPVVEFLHAQNPNLIAASMDDGWTAAMSAGQDGHLPVVKFLHAQNPDLIAATTNEGASAVMSASLNGHLPVVEFLHAQNPDLIAATMDDGASAVMLASQNGHLPVVEFLHAQNPDLIAATKDDGTTAVMLASQNGHLSVVKFLHAQNPHLIAAAQDNGATAMMLACLNGHLPVAEYLHAQNPHLIAATTDDGGTTMMLASLEGRLSIVEFLHAENPDLVAATTEHGETALSLAENCGHSLVVEFLKRTMKS